MLVPKFKKEGPTGNRTQVAKSSVLCFVLRSVYHSVSCFASCFAPCFAPCFVPCFAPCFARRVSVPLRGQFSGEEFKRRLRECTGYFDSIVASLASSVNETSELCVRQST